MCTNRNTFSISNLEPMDLAKQQVPCFYLCMATSHNVWPEGWTWVHHPRYWWVLDDTRCVSPSLPERKVTSVVNLVATLLVLPGTYRE